MKNNYMFMKWLLIISMGFYFVSLFSCNDQSEIIYSIPDNPLEMEIDHLLTESEHLLFTGEFKLALEKIDRVEILANLLSVSEQRHLRLLFDKALVVTCIEGETDNSLASFKRCELFLHSKNCEAAIQNETEAKQNWPIYGPDKMSPEECRQTIDNTLDFALIAAGSLPVGRQALFVIQSTLYSMGRKAKGCCTEYGFWKTCVQPLVDAAKNMKCFGIPPDPAWD